MDAHNTSFLPEDVFLVSYPKSGNTWMRFLIGNYLTGNRCDFTNYHLIIPDIHFNPGQIAALPYRPRLVKSHFPFTPAYRKVVYIVRDGRDVALSYYFKFIKQRQIRPETRFQDFLEVFNRGGLEGFPSWSSHIQSWLDDPPEKFLLVRYEDMKTDTLSELIRVLEFSGFPVNRGAAAAAAEASDFRRMQEMEKKQYHLVPQLAHSDPNIPSVRKGTIGESKAYFSDAITAKFIRIHGHALERLGYLPKLPVPVSDFGANRQHIILTGIPRSGTTLACRLLNKAENIVALNEPVDFGDPNIQSQLRFDNHDRICDAAERFFKDMRNLILTQKLALSNQVQGLATDNNFAEYYADDGLRKNLSSRAYIRIEKPLSDDFLLVINNNAMFTGILESLIPRFPIYALIRNPLAVLASWNSVDFDLRYGRSPAERVDMGLAERLKKISDVTERQLCLLSWFFEKYLKLVPKKFILPYESLVGSGGNALSLITPGAANLHEPLESRNLNRLYNREQMLRLGEKLLKSEGTYWEFYSRQHVESLMNACDSSDRLQASSASANIKEIRPSVQIRFSPSMIHDIPEIMPKPENLYHCCIQKTGSQWIRSIFSDPATVRYSGLTPYHYQNSAPGAFRGKLTERFITEALPKHTFVSPLYFGFENFIAMPKPEHYKAFFIMRDPRDIVISWYFSMKYSHPPGGKVPERREILRQLPLSEGIIRGIEFLNERGHFAALRSWADAPKKDPNVLLLRYEDLIISDNLPIFKKLFSHCDIQMPEDELRQLLQKYSFERLSGGRMPGQEDQMSHYRKGISGDWKNYFNEEISRKFNEIAGDLLSCPGYEEQVAGDRSQVTDHSFQVNSIRQPAISAKY